MNKYRFNSNPVVNDKQSINEENDVANRFKDYLIKQFYINNETVTKLEKSRVKQIYVTQFKQESEGRSIRRSNLFVYFDLFK
jgi:hypothetical protein